MAIERNCFFGEIKLARILGAKKCLKFCYEVAADTETTLPHVFQYLEWLVN